MRVRHMRVKRMRNKRMRVRDTLYSPVFEFTWEYCFHFRETFEILA